jgi:Ca2+/Na+ antiporter
MDHKNVTDDEIVEASRTGIHKESYMAQTEMMRRLKNSIDKMSKSADFYSDRLLDLTILLFLIGIVQILISLRAISESWNQWAWLAAIFMFALYRFVMFISKEREEREKKEQKEK